MAAHNVLHRHSSAVTCVITAKDANHAKYNSCCSHRRTGNVKVIASRSMYRVVKVHNVQHQMCDGPNARSTQQQSQKLSSSAQRDRWANRLPQWCTGAKPRWACSSRIKDIGKYKEIYWCKTTRRQAVCLLGLRPCEAFSYWTTVGAHVHGCTPTHSTSAL